MKKLLGIIMFIALCVPAFAGDITGAGMLQGDLYKALYNMQYNQLYGTVQSPAMSYAGAASKNVSYGACTIRNAGFAYALSASTNAVPNGTVATQSVTTGLYLLESTSAGVIYVKGGTAVTPDPTAGRTPMAIVKVAKAATNTAGFKFGVTGLSSDTPSQTVTFYNVGAMVSGKYKVSLKGL